MGYLETEIPAGALDTIGLLLQEDAPYPISVGDRVRVSQDDLSLGTAGTVTALGSDPTDGVVTHDVAWDDGTAGRAVRGSALRCVTLLEAAKAAPMSNVARRPGESLTSWGERLKAGDALLAKASGANHTKPSKTRSGTTASTGDFETKHPRGRGGRWVVGAGASGSDVRTIQRRVGAKVDGQFGGMTKAAVMSFQRRHGLQVDGVVGAQTVAAMRGRRQKVAPGRLTSSDLAWLAGNKNR